ncbi:MAG: DUF1667 domain-containing protein [Candidatus Margulisbacteria bacterium]|jgi:CxxC motif-containing protein|nr:DUF1667 domain-containing protein [Candidatus Margulisiibacteriota bacterium]
MQNKLTCIICPNSCVLTVELADGAVRKISGNKCPRGLQYGKQEILDPRRWLTSSVAAYGLELTMVPVKSARPLPKDKLLPAMEQVRKYRLGRPVRAGATLLADLAGTGIALIATRDAKQI